jgi:hypothetical protein
MEALKKELEKEQYLDLALKLIEFLMDNRKETFLPPTEYYDVVNIVAKRIGVNSDILIEFIEPIRSRLVNERIKKNTLLSIKLRKKQAESTSDECPNCHTEIKEQEDFFLKPIGASKAERDLHCSKCNAYVRAWNS